MHRREATYAQEKGRRRPRSAGGPGSGLRTLLVVRSAGPTPGLPDPCVPGPIRSDPTGRPPVIPRAGSEDPSPTGRTEGMVGRRAPTDRAGPMRWRGGSPRRNVRPESRDVIPGLFLSSPGHGARAGSSAWPWRNSSLWSERAGVAVPASAPFPEPDDWALPAARDRSGGLPFPGRFHGPCPGPPRTLDTSNGAPSIFLYAVAWRLAEHPVHGRGEPALDLRSSGCASPPAWPGPPASP